LFALIVNGVRMVLDGHGFTSESRPFSLDVHNDPPAMLWVIANFPAGVLFVNAFGKTGA